LADANTSAKPVEIRVAQGTYKPDEGAGVEDANRTETFQLINGVTLKGGYAGDGEPDPNARDITNYETILIGDLAGNDVPVSDPYDFLSDEPTRAENSYHVVSGAGIDETSVLDGFVVTAGNANYDWGKGGGMYSDDGYPTILNCTFSDNLAYSGGGLYTYNDIGPIVSNCIFSGNYAVHGAVYGKNMTLTSCTFTENMGGKIGPMSGGGGGVSIGDHGNATLIDCVFTRNWAFRGGGMEVYGNSEPRLINCTFIGNSAYFYGGAMCPVLFPGYGMTVINCTFRGNLASGDSIWSGGGAYYTSHDDTKFFNCTFSGNHTNGDGGAYCVSENGGDVAFNNCIFWGNTASGEGPQIAIKTADATVDVNYCDVQGGQSDIYRSAGKLIWGDANNIDVDPCFVDSDGADDTAGTEDDDLRLAFGSPCIDVGDNNSVPADINDIDNDGNTVEPFPWDLDGRPRIIDGDCNDTDIVDMGAYEFGWLYLGDFAGGCDVDFVDFAVLGLTWRKEDGQAGYDPNCDISLPADSLIDEKDLKIFTDNWLSKQ
jgi:hypothetical protein